MSKAVTKTISFIVDPAGFGTMFKSDPSPVAPPTVAEPVPMPTKSTATDDAVVSARRRAALQKLRGRQGTILSQGNKIQTLGSSTLLG